MHAGAGIVSQKLAQLRTYARNWTSTPMICSSLYCDRHEWRIGLNLSVEALTRILTGSDIELAQVLKRE
jgi:hypothetical protein